MELLGDQTVHYHHAEDRLPAFLSTPTSPMRNLYLPQVSLLVAVKLRLGHMIAQQTQIDSRTSDDETKLMYTNSVSILTTALNINQVAACRRMHVEAELYLALGRVQHQLYLLGKYDHREAVSTLVQAIRTSQSYNHDLG